ncbi:MAG: hypothetical protein R2809_01460 [Flavobacteriales bacterium]
MTLSTILSFFKNRYFSFSISVVGIAIILACAGGDYYWESYSNINNRKFVPQTYSLFAFTPDSRYNDGSTPDFYELNIQEWSEFLNNNLTYDDLKELIYKADEKELQRRGLKTKEDKLKRFFQYILIARKSEKYANTHPYWYSSTENVDSLASATYEEWRAFYIAQMDPFLKQRAAFQLVRGAYFGNHPEDGIEVFESNIPNFKKNNIYWRTYGYAAGCYWKMKEYSKANSMYVKMMTENPEYTQSAHYSFHQQDEEGFQKTLQLCSSTEEKVNAWILATVYNDPKRGIIEIMKLDPSHESIGLMVARIVSEFEYEIKGYGEFYYGDDEKTPSKEDIDFLIAQIEKPEFSQKTRALASVGYMYYLLGEAEKAVAFNNRAILSDDGKDKDLAEQLMIFKAIHDCKSLYQLSDTDLRNIKHCIEIGSNDYSGYRSELINTVSEQLRLNNDPLRILFRPTVAEFTDIKNIENAIKELESGTKEDLIREIVFGNLASDKIELVNHLAVLYTYNVQFDAADQLYNKYPEAKNFNSLYGDPFSFRLKDCHDCDHEEYQGEAYSFDRFIHELSKKHQVFESTKSFDSALELGNAYYNMSYYGNARLFGQLPYLNNWYEPEEEELYWYDYYDAMHLNDDENCVDNAKKYWRKAFDLAANDEEKALATFLLSKCELIAFYFNKSESDDRDFVAGVYFNEMMKYKKTKLFDQAINECGYFKTFYNTKN